MKIRNGFVSNSSSSSFIVISEKIQGEIDELPHNLVIGQTGDCEFGWQFDRWMDFDSKLNFAYLQAKHKKEWMDMLYEVLKDYGAVNISVILSEDFDVQDGLRSAYIDHQSSASEGKNTKIFDSKDHLVRFLFSRCSYIQGGNDNTF